VKASGGIRDAATLKAMVDAGANRIGASASVKSWRNCVLREIRGAICHIGADSLQRN